MHYTKLFFLYPIATMNGNIDLCRLILGYIDNSNIKAEDTPLEMAVKNVHLEVARIIIATVKDKNPTDDEGNTHLHWFAEKGNLDFYRFIM